MSTQTIRTEAQLLAEFPDNTQRLITPQDSRDFVVSAFGGQFPFDPTPMDDNTNSGGHGFYDTGSLWLNTSSLGKKLWRCFGGAHNAATWVQIYPPVVPPPSTSGIEIKTKAGLTINNVTDVVFNLTNAAPVATFGANYLQLPTGGIGNPGTPFTLWLDSSGFLWWNNSSATPRLILFPNGSTWGWVKTEIDFTNFGPAVPGNFSDFIYQVAPAGTVIGSYLYENTQTWDWTSLNSPTMDFGIDYGTGFLQPTAMRTFLNTGQLSLTPMVSAVPIMNGSFASGFPFNTHVSLPANLKARIGGGNVGEVLTQGHLKLWTLIGVLPL